MFEWRRLIRESLTASPRGREQVERLAASLGIAPGGVSTGVLVDATARAITATRRA